MPESESQLSRRALAGDRSAANDLYERWAAPLRAFVRRQMSPQMRQLESSSDLVQSVFLEIWKDAPALEYRDDAALRAWVFECARRKVMDHARRWNADKRSFGRPASRELDDQNLLNAYASVCTPSEHLVRREAIECMECALDHLSVAEQEIIQLRFFLAQSYEEIGKVLGKTPGAARVQLHRALQSLRARLDTPDSEVGEP